MKSRSISVTRPVSMRVAIALNLALLLLVALQQPAVSTSTSPEGSLFEDLIKVRTNGGVVVSESMQASRAGIQFLDAGGNAIDAAVATMFAIGVTRPEMCGIGGGGFMLYRGADGASEALDFRETAPAAMQQNTFNKASEGGETNEVKPGIHHPDVNRDGKPDEMSGHTVVGVPGVVAGMDEALNQLGSGKFTLDELIAPAEKYAREGIKVTTNLQVWLFLDQTLGTRLANYPETARVYGGRFVHGTTVYSRAGLDGPGEREGDVEDPTVFKQEDYAKSLRQIMDHGTDAFYKVDTYDDPLLGATVPQSSIGKLIVEDMAAAERNAMTNPVLLVKTSGTPNDIGLISPDDLESYKPVWRTPLKGNYRDHQVITMPPPSGGMVALEILNLLERFKLASFGHSSANHIHALAEAEKLAWADRIAYLADPDKASVPTELLTGKRYAKQRAREIDMERAKSLEDYGPGTTVPPHEGMHTTHFSVIDRDGNAVSITCSLNSAFGSGVVAPGTGFLLNNQLADFDWTWGNDQPAPINAPAGGKRPRAAQSPSIVVKDGQPVLVTGGAGGPTIIGGVVQNILNVVDFDMDIFHAIDAPRVDSVSQCEPVGVLMLESNRIDDAFQTELEKRGHVLCLRATRPEFGPPKDYTNLPLIASAGTDLSSGERLGVSDPRALAAPRDDQGPMGQED
jgi:gamma-glutamyltranspeptidase/glutathione hydrolase